MEVRMAGPPYQSQIDAAEEVAQKAELEQQQAGQKAATEVVAERTARDQHQARVETDLNAASKRSQASPGRQDGAPPPLARLDALNEARTLDGKPARPSSRIEALQNARTAMATREGDSRGLQPRGAPVPSDMDFTARRTYNFRQSRTRTADGGPAIQAEATATPEPSTISTLPDDARRAAESKQMIREQWHRFGKDVAYMKAYLRKHGHYPPDQYDDPQKGTVTVKNTMDPQYSYTSADYHLNQAQADGAREQKEAGVEKSDRSLVKTARLKITENTDKSQGRGAWVPGHRGHGKGGQSIGE
jgi:hypothetical protein